MILGIIDARSGNLTSLEHTLQRAGFETRRLLTPDFEGVDALFLPGQGRFGFVMNQLNQFGFSSGLQTWIKADRPLIGICVGMQVLFSGSEEDPEVPGLGLFPQRVTRLDGPKFPLMGWVKIQWSQGNLPNGSAYFVNSYGIKSCQDSLVTINYGSGFCGGLRRGNLTAFQFHPEKSGSWGREVLRLCLS